MPDHGHEDHFEKQLIHQLREINEWLECICKELKCICKALQPPPATDFALSDFKGEFQMISPIQAGGKGSYLASLIPANAAALQSGPSFASSDPLAVLVQDTTNPFLVTATVDASDTAASFNITVTGVNSAGTSIQHVFLIPITQAPPLAALDFDLNDAPAPPVASPK